MCIRDRRTPGPGAALSPPQLPPPRGVALALDRLGETVVHLPLLAVALCWLGCHAYAPLGQTPRRLVAVRAESEDRAEQIKKLNDMFYGTSTTTTDAADDASTDSSAADASDPLADLPLWRVQWNALPGERQVYNVHVPPLCGNQIVAARRFAPDSLVDFHTGAALHRALREISEGPEALVFRPYTTTGRLGEPADPEVQPKGRPRSDDAGHRHGVPRRRAAHGRMSRGRFPGRGALPRAGREANITARRRRRELGLR